MCLTLKAKILELRGDTALVDFGERQGEVDVRFVEVEEGDEIYCFGKHAIEKV